MWLPTNWASHANLPAAPHLLIDKTICAELHVHGGGVRGRATNIGATAKSLFPRVFALAGPVFPRRRGNVG